MTLRTKIEIVAGVVVFLALAVFAVEAIRQHDRTVQAEASSAADQKIAAAAQASIVARDAQQATVDKTAVQQAAAVKTPQQAVQIIEHYLPAPVVIPGQPTPAPAAIPLVQTKDLPASVQAELPNAPGQLALLTPDQLQSIARADIACTATASDLSTCAKDKADLQTQLKAANDRANTWEAAAKGGTKFHRFLKAAERAGCSAVGSAAGSIVDKNHPTRDAAIGAAAGSAICSLF